MAEKRIKFEKGEQRKFFDLVILKSGAVSLRGLLQFGIDIKYSTLKCYYNEFRNMPKGLFLDLCHIARIDSKRFNVIYLEGNYGQVKGGKLSKRKK